MRRKASVEIVTGFLGAGKTTFINSYIDITKQKDEELLIIQLESGKSLISENIIQDKQITLKKYNNKEMEEALLLRAIKFYRPNRIIIECNGVGNLDKLINFLNLKELKKYISISSITTLIDGITGNLFIKNMAPIIIPNILAADLIIINNCNKASINQIDNLQNTIENLNLHAHIIKCNDNNDIKNSLTKCSIIKKF